MLKLVNFILCVYAMLCSFACTPSVSDVNNRAPWPLTDASSRAGSYRLQIGDEIEVFVLEDTSFNGIFTVRPSGDVIMPKVGRISLVGLTLIESEGRIKSSLEANQLRQATVIVDPGTRGASGGGVTVRVTGEVAKTGRVTLQPLGSLPVSAYQAIVDAGGFKPFANKRKSYILRSTVTESVRINVNFEDIEAGKAEDPQLIEGDCLVVPVKAFGF